MPKTSDIKDIRAKIRDMLLEKNTVDDVASALLGSGWNFKDVKRLMEKPAEDVEEFLLTMSYEVNLYSDMYESRRKLFKMICDAYCRALADQDDVRV